MIIWIRSWTLSMSVKSNSGDLCTGIGDMFVIVFYSSTNYVVCCELYLELSRRLSPQPRPLFSLICVCPPPVSITSVMLLFFPPPSPSRSPPLPASSPTTPLSSPLPFTMPSLQLCTIYAQMIHTWMEPEKGVRASSTSGGEGDIQRHQRLRLKLNTYNKCMAGTHQ
jgi:hypothetical protein